MAGISRRCLLGAAAAAGLLPLAAGARPASVPSIWEGQKMYETFAKDGTGFSYPGPEGRKLAFVAFDAQCPDCMRFIDHMKPLDKYVEVRYFPISYLNIHSEPQGTTMLMSETPWKVMDEQHEHFRDPDFRGIRYDVSKLPAELRNKVWMNTKLHRRCGCRAVPFGVFKNSKGEYVALDENLTTEELAKIFELPPIPGI